MTITASVDLFAEWYYPSLTVIWGFKTEERIFNHEVKKRTKRKCGRP